MTMARLTRRNEDLRRRVGRLIKHLQGKEAKTYEGPFPVRRLLQVTEKLKATIDETLKVEHEDMPSFDLADTHPGWVGHAAR